MPGKFSPPPEASDPNMHHSTCVTHVLWCMLGLLPSSFLWSRRRGKTFPVFPAHAQPAMLRIWQEAHEHLYLFRLKCGIWYPSSMFVYHFLKFLWQMAVQSDAANQSFRSQNLLENLGNNFRSIVSFSFSFHQCDFHWYIWQCLLPGRRDNW